MYRVADDMERIMMISEMRIAWYTDQDIEYMKNQLQVKRELISEGAAASIYASCKYLVTKVAQHFQARLALEDYTITEKERLMAFNTIRNNIPKIFLEYEKGDIEEYMREKIFDIYKYCLVQLHS